MRVVFVTHNRLGEACIEELSNLGADVRAVFTRPPEADIADQTSLRQLCEETSASLHYVESVNDSEVVDTIEGYDPQLLFVVGWSQLVEQEVIDLASVASLGMHPTPLPRGRGRAPIAWSLIKGLDRTSLTCFHLVEAADAGDIATSEPIPITSHDDAGTLYEKVVEAGRIIIRDLYPTLEAGTVPREPQTEDEATWWPKREPADGFVDWTKEPTEIYDWIRAQTHPYPGAYSVLDGDVVRVWAANQPTGERCSGTPGEILEPRGTRLAVAAWEGVLEVTSVQVEDGPEIDAADLVRRYRFEPGDEFARHGHIIADDVM